MSVALRSGRFSRYTTAAVGEPALDHFAQQLPPTMRLRCAGSREPRLVAAAADDNDGAEAGPLVLDLERGRRLVRATPFSFSLPADSSRKPSVAARAHALERASSDTFERERALNEY